MKRKFSATKQKETEIQAAKPLRLLMAKNQTSHESLGMKAHKHTLNVANTPILAISGNSSGMHCIYDCVLYNRGWNNQNELLTMDFPIRKMNVCANTHYTYICIHK